MELLLTAGSRLLDMGRSVRSFTAAQRRAILARDGGCRSCGAPPDTSDIHHVIPWDEGGRTDIDNGVADDELVRLRLRLGDGDPRTIEARDRVVDLIDRYDRAA
jgi:hypothetical protein